MHEGRFASKIGNIAWLAACLVALACGSETDGVGDAGNSSTVQDAADDEMPCVGSGCSPNRPDGAPADQGDAGCTGSRCEAADDAGGSDTGGPGPDPVDAGNTFCTPEDCEGQPSVPYVCPEGDTLVLCLPNESGQCIATVECGERCGGFIGEGCGAGEFCNVGRDVGGDGCDVSDGQGICTPQSMACPRIYDPVCSCDLRSYASPCDAHAAGASVRHAGLCTAEECVSGGGRPEYSNGASTPECEPGEDSFPIPGREPAVCCR